MGTPERRQREKIERKESILKAACDMLMQKGFINATMQDIADAAELSVGTIYLYFKDKVEIFEQLYLNGIEELRVNIAEAAQKASRPDDRLRGMGMAYLFFHNEKKSLFDMISHFFSFPEILFPMEKRSFFAGRGSAILDIIQETISAGIQSGIFRQTDTVKGAIMLWSSLHGLLLLKKMEDVLFSRYDFEELYRYNLDHLIEALA